MSAFLYWVGIVLHTSTRLAAVIVVAEADVPKLVAACAIPYGLLEPYPFVKSAPMTLATPRPARSAMKDWMSNAESAASSDEI